MTAHPTCPKCRGTRWVRYFSETTDGTFEEAFRLCSCNHKPAAGDEHVRVGERTGLGSAAEALIALLA